VQREINIISNQSTYLFLPIIMTQRILLYETMF